MGDNDAINDAILRNVVFSIEILVTNSWSQIIDSDGPFNNIVDQVNFITNAESNNANIGVEIVFKDNATIPHIRIIADMIKIDESIAIQNISNLFKLLPQSYVVNRLFGDQYIDYIGLDIYDNSEQVLNIVNSQNNRALKAGEIILLNSFIPKSIKLFFIHEVNGSLDFCNPSIVFRILGALHQQYCDLVLISHEYELMSYNYSPEAVDEYPLPELFHLKDFILYLNNLPEQESEDSRKRRQKLLRRLLENEYDHILSKKLELDVGSRTIYVNNITNISNL